MLPAAFHIQDYSDFPLPLLFALNPFNPTEFGLIQKISKRAPHYLSRRL